ncbi:MAG: ABC transporter ATP-binding protein [Oscillospiraceae bacterium]|nr:ABC transporter ATP-binding protein [Oscillospiraceae bacterium]
MAILETRNLSKTYGQGEAAVHALSDVTLQIDAATLTAILGRSGSGKSTLLHLLGGLDTPTSGTVLLEGVDLFAMADSELASVRRRRIGFVFQDFQLLPEYSVRDNILMPLYLDKKTPDGAHLNKITAQLEIEDILKKQPWQLSGGQQQRTAIARALIARPAIILADEPTGNLDTESGKRIYSLLRQTVEDFSQTVVVVTHDLQLAAQADRKITIDDGQVDSRSQKPCLAVLQLYGTQRREHYWEKGLPK